MIKMIETFSNGEKITSKDWELIDEMVQKLELNLIEAIELREFDKFGADKETMEEKEEKKASWSSSYYKHIWVYLRSGLVAWGIMLRITE